MMASFEHPRPTVLLPDFTRDDYSALEAVVVAFVVAPVIVLRDLAIV